MKSGIKSGEIAVGGERFDSAQIRSYGSIRVLIFVRGDGTTGVYGVSANGVGVTGESATGFAMYANGNAGQARDKGGFVKTMI